MEADVSYVSLLWDMRHPDLQELLKSGIRVNEPDAYGEHLLTVACARLQPESARLLIECGANVDCKNSEGDTPLLCAINVASHNPSAAYEIVKALLEAGANIELRGYMDKTPFLKACSRGCLDVLKLLVSNGCNVHAVSNEIGGSVGGEEFASIFETSVEFREYVRGLRNA